MEKIVRKNLFFGSGLLGLSVFLLILGNPFMKTWFYIFAWWSLILILDSINFRLRGNSPLYGSPGLFFIAAFFSVFVWLIFELFNMRMENWNYHGLPDFFPIRWLGYFLAFATVIPALIELSTLFNFILKKPIIKLKIKVTPSRLNALTVFGMVCLVGVVVFPRVLFPLVWVGFIFLMEPINFRWGADSLLADLEKADSSRIQAWLLAGLAAGIIWELLNYWSGSHWKYSIPYLNFGRIFQMPVFGYGGFPPFALEVFAIWAFLRHVHRKLSVSPILRFVVILLFLCFYAFVFSWMDSFYLG